MEQKRIQKNYSDVEAVDILHQVANLYISTKVPQDYGTGEDYTSVEVHTLKHISDNPGITVTELARDYAKTKGAVSQILKKLEQKNLIYRQSDPANENRILFFLTEKGKVLDIAHKKYDAVSFGESMGEVRKRFSDEEVDIAFSVLEAWLEIRREVQQRRMERRKQKKKGEKK
mgnify:CR=1 FL=1